MPETRKNPVFDHDCLRDVLARLAPAEMAFAAGYPGDPDVRQPVHTVYGGAHLFMPDTISRLGAAARRTQAEYAPDWAAFARAIGLAGAERLPSLPAQRARLEALIASDPEAARRTEPAAWLAHQIHARTLAKLEREPVEDYRIDFEDGYGVRPDAEEDAHAIAAGEAMARAHKAGALPPFCGIRLAPLTVARAARAARTLERFTGALLTDTGGALPAGFVVTLPKVTSPAEVEALVLLLARLEQAHGLAAGELRCELMLETPQAILGADGRVPLRALVAAAGGRCRGVHVGVYDYTAALGIAAADQSLAHPAAAFARQVAQAALAGSGVTLSDGAHTKLPLPAHRAAEGVTLTPAQLEANRTAVHGAWRSHFEAVRRALREGWAQGWDLHPAQLPTRHAAVIAHHLEGLDEAAARLRAFVERAGAAGAHEGTMDDAATGQGLLNFFVRGLATGALVEADVAGTGLTPEELRSRDFARILATRVKH
jgi:citrate lyase beta subunit